MSYHPSISLDAIAAKAKLLAHHLRRHLPARSFSPTEALAAWETWRVLEGLTEGEADYAWDVLQAYIAGGQYDLGMQV